MSPRKPGNAKSLVLKAAADLFYRQGYHPTTVDQIIEQSGVSKPTVYKHFPTKEDLCVAYLQDRFLDEISGLKAELSKIQNPKKRVIKIIEYFGEGLIATHYRGCGFYNMISELAETKTPIVDVARKYADTVRTIIRETVQNLQENDADFQNLNVDYVADSYYLILNGMVASSQEYQQDWPIKQAIKQIKQLLN